MTVCYYHVTHAFQREWLYSCLNVKELFARSRREIWSLSDCNWTRTHNHLVHKRTLNHLAKLALSGCGFESSCCHVMSDSFVKKWNPVVGISETWHTFVRKKSFSSRTLQMSKKKQTFHLAPFSKRFEYEVINQPLVILLKTMAHLNYYR